MPYLLAFLAACGLLLAFRGAMQAARNLERLAAPTPLIKLLKTNGQLK